MRPVVIDITDENNPRVYAAQAPVTNDWNLFSCSLQPGEHWVALWRDRSAPNSAGEWIIGDETSVMNGFDFIKKIKITVPDIKI